MQEQQGESNYKGARKILGPLLTNLLVDDRRVELVVGLADLDLHSTAGAACSARVPRQVRAAWAL